MKVLIKLAYHNITGRIRMRLGICIVTIIIIAMVGDTIHISMWRIR